MDTHTEIVASIATLIKGIVLDIRDIQKQKEMLNELFTHCRNVDILLFARAVGTFKRDNTEDLEVIKGIGRIYPIG